MKNFAIPLIGALSLSIGIFSTEVSASDSPIYVDHYELTEHALIFNRAAEPQSQYYLPRTETFVNCQPLSPGSRLWTCTLALVRPSSSPRDRRAGSSFYPFTPSQECQILKQAEDSAIIASLKATALLKIRAQNMTPAGDSGIVCSFEMTMSGDANQVDELKQKLTIQAQNSRLIASPIEIELTAITPVGGELQSYLRSQLKLDPLKAIGRGEASFLVGLAAGQVSATTEVLKILGVPDRAEFYSRAIRGLFTEDHGGLKLQTRALAPEAVAFEKRLQFKL